MEVHLTDEVLTQLAMEDTLAEEFCTLSLNAISGTDQGPCMKLRALVNNKVMLLLVDSGSSHSFVNANFIQHTSCELTQVAPTKVQLANGTEMISDQIANDIDWWCQGHTFHTPMRVLPLGSYDAILGYDWLAAHSPMNCDWNNRTMTFMHHNDSVTLEGVPPPKMQLSTMHVEQLVKWSKGIDIWAYALVQTEAPSDNSPAPEVISTLLDEFSDVFATPTTLPPHRVHDHTIPLLPGAVPVNSKPYRYSPLHKDEIERQVKVLLEQGWIVHSSSPFASPVLLVQKKDGSWHMCVDYRRLNAITVKNRFPIPLVEEILDELAGTTYFTKLDFTADYHQVRMAPQDEHKTAFKTHHGHYHFRVMPFGLTNAPATFQCFMNDILSPFLRKFVMVFMDDILVYSSTLEEHVEHLRAVLSQLRNHQFFLKPSKCSFACSHIEYLGHIISQEGVATDPFKTAAMQDWPVPASATDLRGFLGLTGYYRRFIKGYGVLARPLTNLLKKNSFQWSPQADAAFVALKQAMQTAPVLALPNFQEIFIVETDACALGIGAVLMQNDRPIAFLSKALGEKQRQLSIYEKEFLAVIMTVEKWRSYLQRNEFIIRTDHRSLTYLTEQNLHSELQRKAMARLMGLHFRVVYRKGKENVDADVLSRVAHLFALQAVSVVQPVWLQEVLNSYAADAHAQQLLAQLAVSSPDSNGFELVDGLIKHKGLIWIALRTKIIAALHSSPIGGHSGTKATYYRLKKLFGWKGLRSDVDEFVKQSKHELVHSPGLLQPLPIPDGAWKDITMDFIEGLPKSQNCTSILVVVDRFTKVAHFIPLHHPFTAKDIARYFLDNVVKLHGVPISIVTDRDRIFLSTKLVSSTAYHPQTDGQSEIVNQCLEMYLRCAIYASPRDWKAWLSLAELWYNSSHHSSLGCSPFKALYGFDPNVGILPDTAQHATSSVQEFIQDRKIHLESLKLHLAAAKNKMKMYADKGLLLKLQPYAQTSVVNRPFPKLAFKYFGPYTVVERVGTAAYRLQLLAGALIHPVFHVSQLKPFTPDHTPVFSDITKFIELDKADVVPEAILDHRLVKKGNQAVPRVLIKWTNIPAAFATWEDYYVVKERFPTAIAWGQATPQGGGTVRTDKEGDV
ncbi:hypothetical protein U9M48_002607 [Paspalum notatum var. saurae]|uniref:Reverse transcriptase n=1 Tax=Paspalum notatum var. saurae TaxID=547442 RepID=A0AAQ3PK31_PASNO